MAQEVDYLKLQNSLILSLCNMLLGIERLRKDSLGHCGFPELMLQVGQLMFLIQN